MNIKEAFVNAFSGTAESVKDCCGRLEERNDVALAMRRLAYGYYDRIPNGEARKRDAVFLVWKSLGDAAFLYEPVNSYLKSLHEKADMTIQ